MAGIKYSHFQREVSGVLVSKHLGEIFREARLKRRLSQCSLSEAANMNSSYYCLIENGEVNLTLKKYLSICQGLRIEPDEIMRDLLDSMESEETRNPSIKY
jgi:transcriptional regulator with XRE-family HTH domain